MATPEMWQCHVCGEGPHLYALIKRCTGVSGNRQCGHSMCPKCKKDGEIPPPIPTGGLRNAATPATTIYHSTMPRTKPNMVPPGNRVDGNSGRYYEPEMR